MNTWKYGMQIKAISPLATGSDLIVDGYASTYDVDLDKEAVQPGAFVKWLDAYKRNPIILADHENTTRSVVGRAETIEAGADGLYLKAVIPDLADPVIQLVRQKIAAGLLRGFSIGGLFTKAGSKITEVQLLEVSVVPIPANPHALFSLAKSLAMQANLDTTPTLGQTEPVATGAGRIRRRQPYGF